MRIIIAMTGASGAIYGIRLLEVLSGLKIETHLVLSNWAKKTIELETDYSVQEVIGMPTRYYEETDLAAPISSGSFKNDGMVIIPCSMKTLAAISLSLNSNLICRSADVTLKERRKLLVVPRETPFNALHLENMLRIAKAGGIIMPPMPAFYTRPKTIFDIINHNVGRILDHFGIEAGLVERWGKKDG